jgi:RNA polymerase sigma factor (sigma-70 family)
MSKHFGNTQQIENLLERIQAGDERACEDLIKESQERLRRLASKMLKGFPGVARLAGQTEDVLQPVLNRLYQTLQKKQFDSGKALIAYAAKMIRCELLDLSRKYRLEISKHLSNRPDANGRMLINIIDKPAPDIFANLEKWGSLHEAVEQLPEDEKTVIELRLYEEKSRQDTAIILDIDENTVTRRYGRAIDKLGLALKELVSK